MGQFSWISVDTKEPIYCSDNHQRVTMVYQKKTLTEQKKGRVTVVGVLTEQISVVETAYEGYGMFGGKDFFTVLATMNAILPYGNTTEIREEFMRQAGIDLYYGDRKILYPQLFLGIPPAVVDFTVKVQDDPEQGRYPINF